MSTLESLVVNSPVLAYTILFGGMFIEGETFIMTAVILASQGLMEWWLIGIVTFVGVILGDLTWYFLGRFGQESFAGKWLQKKFPTYHEWMDINFIARYKRMAFLSKFLYYVNRLTPLIAGWHKMEVKRFFKIHLTAAALWVVTMLIVGQLFVIFVEVIGAQAILKKIEWLAIGFAVIFIGGEVLLKKFFAKKIKRSTANK